MNISDIAELAGVSKAAVSRYFNDGYISEEKRERIRKVVEETGYQPSAQAQTLRTRKTKTIGVIIPKINSDSVSRVVAGISSVLEETGYQLLLGNTYNNVSKELDYLRLFSNKRVDGVIFLATVLSKKHRELLKEIGVPVVIVGQKLPGYNCVYHDDKNAIREMTELVADKGCKNIVYLAASTEREAAGAERNSGFKLAAEENDIHSRVLTVGFDMEGSYDKLNQLDELLSDMDAIVCATDSIAISALKYVREHGKRVPEDVRITGLGDSRMAGVTSPAISTVHFFYKTSGAEAAQMLMDVLEGKNVVRQLCIGYEIKEQGTT